MVMLMNFEMMCRGRVLDQSTPPPNTVFEVGNLIYDLIIAQDWLPQLESKSRGRKNAGRRGQQSFRAWDLPVAWL